MPAKNTRLTSALVVAASLAFAFFLAEGAVRLVMLVDKPLGYELRGYDPMGAEIIPNGDLGYRQRPNSVFHYFNGTTASANSEGFRGPTVAQARAPGTIRIVLLGGSTTHGYGVNDDQTIDAYMRELLPTRYPDWRFEVVNLGFDGYDSFQILQRLKSDGLPLQPNIVVLNEGINDVRNAWYPNLREADPRTLIWADVVTRMRAEERRGGPTLWTRVKHAFVLARVPGFIRDQLRRRAQLHAQHSAPAAASAVQPSTGRAPYPDAAVYFDKHIREAVGMTLDAGAGVLLSTPPSALRSYPPTAKSEQGYWVWDAKTTQAYRDTLAGRLRTIDAEEEHAGKLVRYVSPMLPLPLFLDDCHLRPDGNRAMAAALTDALAPFIPARGNVAVR